MSYQPRLLPGFDPIRRVLNVNTLQFHYTFGGSVRITLGATRMLGLADLRLLGRGLMNC